MFDLHFRLPDNPRVEPAKKGKHINYEIPFEEMRPISNLITTIKTFKEKAQVAV